MMYKDKEKLRKCKQRYRKRHKEAIAAYNRKYRDANPEKLKELNRIYREANKEEIAENKQRAITIGHMYLGMVGMTRKQRQKFQKELDNGKTE